MSGTEKNRILSAIFGISINEILLGEKFSFSVNDNKALSLTEENQKIEEIISSTDETIVDILKDKEKEINKINISVRLLIFVCSNQVLIFLFLLQLFQQYI